MEVTVLTYKYMGRGVLTNCCCCFLPVEIARRPGSATLVDGCVTIGREW
jgi:hypothetical protein